MGFGRIRPRHGSGGAILDGHGELAISKVVVILAEAGQDGLAIRRIGIKEFQSVRVADHLISAVAGYTLALPVPDNDAAVFIEGIHHHRHVLNGQPHALLAGSQGLLGLFASGNILEDSTHLHAFSVFKDRLANRAAPQQPAFGSVPLQFQIKRHTLPDRLPVGGLEDAAVLFLISVRSDTSRKRPCLARSFGGSVSARMTPVYTVVHREQT